MRGKINKIISINQTSLIRSSVVDKQHLHCVQELRPHSLSNFKWSSKHITKKKNIPTLERMEKKSWDQKDLMHALSDYNIDTI